MAAHGICFDFYYQPKSSQIGQNGLAAAADACLAEYNKLCLCETPILILLVFYLLIRAQLINGAKM